MVSHDYILSSFKSYKHLTVHITISVSATGFTKVGILYNILHSILYL